MFNKGKSGNPAGRPITKSLGVDELISRDTVKAYKVLSKAIMAGEPWAMDIFFRELLPNEKTITDIKRKNLNAR